MKKYLNMILDKKSLIKNNLQSKSFYIALILSLSLLYFIFKDFDFDYFLLSLKDINAMKLLIASLILMVAVYVRAIRWRYLIQKDNISTHVLYKGQLIGYFINNILPLRAGEFIKSYYVGNKLQEPKTFIFGTVFLERFFDFIGLLFLIILMLNSSLLDVILDNFSYVIFAVLVLFLIGILAMYSFKKEFFKEKIKNRLTYFIVNIINGFSKISNLNILISLFLTIIIWSIYILEVHLVQSAFNIELSLHESIFILLISSIFMLLPAIPGNFGTFEASVVSSFVLFEKYNIDAHVDDVVGFSLVLHLVSYIPYTIFGFIYCLQEIKFLLIKIK